VHKRQLADGREKTAEWETIFLSVKYSNFQLFSKSLNIQPAYDTLSTATVIINIHWEATKKSDCEKLVFLSQWASWKIELRQGRLPQVKKNFNENFKIEMEPQRNEKLFKFSIGHLRSRQREFLEILRRFIMIHSKNVTFRYSLLFLHTKSCVSIVYKLARDLRVKFFHSCGVSFSWELLCSFNLVTTATKKVTFTIVSQQLEEWEREKKFSHTIYSACTFFNHIVMWFLSL
jgi:hypothetical protein